MAEPLKASLNQLARMPGVLGVAVDFRESTLAEEFQRPYPDADRETLHLLLSHMLGNLESSDREFQEVFFEFRSATLFLAVERDARLVVLLEDREAVSYVSKAAANFLRDNYYLLQTSGGTSFTESGQHGPAQAGGDPQAQWQQFLDKIRALLSKVLGGAQSERLIDRILVQQDLRRSDSVEPDLFYEIGSRIIGEVPNRGRQRALLSELRSYLDENH
jgi:hypothetical protein